MLSAHDAAELYTLLERHGIRCWVTGGWGIDALLGRQTRPHKDLDIFMLRGDLNRLEQLLGDRGYRRLLVWEENVWIPGVSASGEPLDPLVSAEGRPSAFVLSDAHGREVDIHVLDVDAQGELVPLWDSTFRFDAGMLGARGSIAGVELACASVAAQLRAHEGYELPEAQRRDIEHLLAVFGQGNAGRADGSDG
jgi:lincosamide nucleotidyltransferase A/C/D/E